MLDQSTNLGLDLQFARLLRAAVFFMMESVFVRRLDLTNSCAHGSLLQVISDEEKGRKHRDAALKDMQA